MTELFAETSNRSGSEDPEMTEILEKMLEKNEDITARAVARLHPRISHASSITRSVMRNRLLVRYQEKQKEIRKILLRHKKRSQKNIAEDIAQRNHRIAELEKQVEILTVSHLAMIRVVGELGGMSKWVTFFESYSEITTTLKDLGAMPRSKVEIT